MEILDKYRKNNEHFFYIIDIVINLMNTGVLYEVKEVDNLYFNYINKGLVNMQNGIYIDSNIMQLEYELGRLIRVNELTEFEILNLYAIKQMLTNVYGKSVEEQLCSISDIFADICVEKKDRSRFFSEFEEYCRLNNIELLGEEIIGGEEIL